MITSTSNPQVKNLQQLMKKARARNTQDVFLAEGMKMFEEAPKERVNKVYLSKSLYEVKGDSFLKGLPMEILEDHVFASVSDTKTPQGILCVIRQFHYQAEDLLCREHPVLLLLEDLQDPGNVGTILRTAEGAGVSGVFLSRTSVDLYNPKTIRSTMGSVYRVPFFYTEELKDMPLVPGTEAIVKRCIHTSADFEYAKNLVFSENAVEKIQEAVKNGASIVTDTQMGKAGINKNRLKKYGGQVYCFMSDEDVAIEAKRRGLTRAAVSMEKAAKLDEKLIFAFGNAPTALIRLYELIREGRLLPEAVIAVPVGFVNVVQSKELILTLKDTPYIVARGRKGGSNIAACICNAFLYMME